MSRFLLAGVPRSGTSWTAKALSCAAGVRYANEPDGFRDAYAFRVMMRHGENPRINALDDAPDYERLWAGAFAGNLPPRGVRGWIAARSYGRAGTAARQRARAGDGTGVLLHVASSFARPPTSDPKASHVLAKSVQCARSIEWIYEKFAPTVLVLSRNPFNTLASWRDLDYVRNAREHASIASYALEQFGVTSPDHDASQLTQQAFVFAVLQSALRRATANHPEWIVASHDDLCVDAPTRVRQLAERLGLEWTEQADRFLRDSERSGAGYATNRMTREQPDRWRERLSPGDVDTIRSVLADFPEWTNTDF